MDAISSVVARVLPDLFRNGPMSQGKLEVAWRIAVGETLCRVSKVRLQPEGRVEIYVADQRWHRELKRSSAIIHTRLVSLLGSDAVKQIIVI